VAEGVISGSLVVSVSATTVRVIDSDCAVASAFSTIEVRVWFNRSVAFIIEKVAVGESGVLINGMEQELTMTSKIKTIIMELKFLYFIFSFP
jgi:hypothetical protein